MATSSQIEGGRESAPQTPSTSLTEPPSAYKDVQQLTGHQEQRPPEPQNGSSTLTQEDAQPPHIKEEEGGLWTTQEGERFIGLEEADLTKLPLTGVSVKIEDHEDKPCESLHWLFPSDVQQMIGHIEIEGPLVGTTVKRGDPQPLHVKEEEDELWITQEGEGLLETEEADVTGLPLTVVCVKTDDHEEKLPESSQLHHSPSEENRGAEPPSSRSPQHMTTEADGGHCGGSQADNLLAPLSDSDDTTSHSPEDEDMDDTQEPLSSDTYRQGDISIDTEYQRSECSIKKTCKKHWTCSVCAKRFSFKCHLTQHVRKHTGEQSLSCSVYGQRLYHPSGMVSHRKHTGKKTFSCSVCDKRFSWKAAVVRHMRTHTGEKPFSCSVCDKRFTRKAAIVRHMRTHTGEKPFVCSVCGQRFFCQSGMVSHMKTHAGEKPFGCSLCGKRFSWKIDSVRHMGTHTGHKPFSCSVCDKRFFRKALMVRHMRTHTGEKPFDCSVCGQRFTRKSNMLSHMSTHTGHKPFSCSVCGKSYSRKKSLTTHMQTHNGE
ncbi:zinc finger protein 25-like [Dunckerocampus dactyliophorus]|uniref:zinc finger protein 25-like n=1 Tax=Dunckerocampus dactyliophorus TaxID=161453 RepID=UPI002405800A|nr:zinc finger protein 25-like [Dunckerocampus dactyliophorus]